MRAEDYRVRLAARECNYKVPTVPNFIVPTGPLDIHVPVGSLTDEEVERVIQAWGDKFRAHVQQKRKRGRS